MEKIILKKCIYIVEIYERMVGMRRIVHYRESYKIVITDKFYEISDGKTVLYYDQLRYRPTVQEVWNKTIGLYQSREVTDNGRRTKTYN